MYLSSQLHVPAALTQEKNTTVLTK